MRADWSSSYMQRMMASRDPTVAAAARARVMDRVNEAAGSLERMSNVNYIVHPLPLQTAPCVHLATLAHAPMHAHTLHTH